MNALKRLVLIVFGLVGVLCIVGLVAPWIGPYQREATMLMSDNYYFMVILAAAAVTALGILVFCFLRGLFAPRRRKTVVISRSKGDQISVSTAAISSQATHVVESDGRFVTEKVRVDANGRSNVKVDLRVRPRNTVDLSQEGQLLHDRLAQGLSVICGDRVRHINIQFVEAENPAPALDVVVEDVAEAQQLEGGLHEPAAEPVDPFGADSFEVHEPEPETQKVEENTDSFDDRAAFGFDDDQVQLTDEEE